MKDILLKNQAVLNECIYIFRSSIDSFTHQFPVEFENSNINHINLASDIESALLKGDIAFAEQVEQIKLMKKAVFSEFNDIQFPSVFFSHLCQHAASDVFRAQLSQYGHLKEICIEIKNYLKEHYQ